MVGTSETGPPIAVSNRSEWSRLALGLISVYVLFQWSAASLGAIAVRPGSRSPASSSAERCSSSTCGLDGPSR
jgi:hypothetical protein